MSGRKIIVPGAGVPTIGEPKMINVIVPQPDGTQAALPGVCVFMLHPSVVDILVEAIAKRLQGEAYVPVNIPIATPAEDGLAETGEYATDGKLSAG